MAFETLSKEKYAELEKDKDKLKQYAKEWAANELKDIPKKDRDVLLELFDPEVLYSAIGQGSYTVYSRIAAGYKPHHSSDIQMYKEKLKSRDFKNNENTKVGKDLYSSLWSISSNFNLPLDRVLIYTFKGQPPSEVKRGVISSSKIPENVKGVLAKSLIDVSSSKILVPPLTTMKRNVTGARIPDGLPFRNTLKEAHTEPEIPKLNSSSVRGNQGTYKVTANDKIKVLDSTSIEVNGIVVKLPDVTIPKSKEKEAKGILEELIKNEELILAVRNKFTDKEIEAEIILNKTKVQVQEVMRSAGKADVSPSVAPNRSTSEREGAYSFYNINTGTVEKGSYGSPKAQEDQSYNGYTNKSDYLAYLKNQGHVIKERNGRYYISDKNNPNGESVIIMPKSWYDTETPSTDELSKRGDKPILSESAKNSSGYIVHNSLMPIKEYNKKGGGTNVWEAGNYYFNASEYQVYIDDADTIDIKVPGGVTIRFVGVDAHEKNTPAGQAAKNALTNYLKGKNIVVKTSGKRTYNRELGTIYVAETGENINAWVIKNQWARFYPEFNDEVDPALLKELEDAMKIAIEDYENGRGPGRLSALNKEWADPDIWRRLPGEMQESFNRIWGKVNGVPTAKDSTDTNINALIDENSGKPFDKKGIKWKEDDPISMDSEFKHLAGEASIAHLSRLYDTYYSAADVKIWIKREDGKNPVMVDLITGIGYNYQINSMPVYTIGSRFPVFFTRGNALGNGTLVVPFKHAKYMRAMLKYVFDEYDDGAKTKAEVKRDPEGASDEDFSNAYSSSLDSVSDIIEIGSVVSLFDIEIRFDNSNAFARDFGKSKIILKDCKLTGDGIDISSGRDVSLQQAYSFIFKSLITGDANERIGKGTPKPE